MSGGRRVDLSQLTNPTETVRSAETIKKINLCILQIGIYTRAITLEPFLNTEIHRTLADEYIRKENRTIRLESLFMTYQNEGLNQNVIEKTITLEMTLELQKFHGDMC